MRRVTLVGTLVVVLLSTLLAMNAGRVWAQTYTFSPNPPVVGLPFTITSSDASDIISVYSVSTCNSPNFITGGVGQVTVPAPPAATQYSFFTSDTDACTPFNIVPASIPEYPNPSYGLSVLAVLMILAYSIIKRRSSH